MSMRVVDFRSGPANDAALGIVMLAIHD